jgi:hypothetical protein
VTSAYNNISENDKITYRGFPWLIRRVLDLMIKVIGPLYNLLQQFTNHHLRLDTLGFWPHYINPLTLELFYTSKWTPLYSSNSPSILMIGPSYNSSARTPRKTPSSVVKNACLLVCYLAMDVLLLLRACASRMCLPSRCLPMGICVTIIINPSRDIARNSRILWCAL